MSLCPAPPPPVPYTTLFRSFGPPRAGPSYARLRREARRRSPALTAAAIQKPGSRPLGETKKARQRRRGSLPRSEEHTSELQSLRHLVCRLLLHKKKS